jgi:small conductance mechanosensitive channel
MAVLNGFLPIEIIKPGTFFGAVFYALVFLVLAWLGARALRLCALRLLKRNEHRGIDHTVAFFFVQLFQIGVYLLALIFYAHLIPALHNLGTVLLTSAGVGSVVIGLAAQNTLGNVIADISLLLYRPFIVGDRVQVSAPTGLEIGVVESITLA